MLTGRVLDSVTGLPVPGAKLVLQELSQSEADGGGVFSIAVPQAGTISIEAEAAGYFPRRTHARTGSAARLEIELLPQGNEKFDLSFYDHVFRFLGESGTNRWVTEPSFEILGRVFDCVDHQTTDACDLFEATDELVPGQFLALARDVVTADSARYTGGAVLGTSVQITEVTPGTRITRSQAWVRDKVRFVIARMPTDSSWATRWIYSGTSNYYSSFIVISKAHKAERGVYSHELAHALGFSHPIDGYSVPIPSIMRYGDLDGPHPNDILHGAILYRRPPGSRTPDVDPDDFVLNALRAPIAGAGELIEQTMR
jgi:hypothetical protein